MTVVGHSFGGAVALSLAAARPDLVAGTGAARPRRRPGRRLDARDRRRHARLARLHRPRRGPQPRRSSGSWGEVDDPAELERELDEHLVDLPNGRVGWRISIPAMMSYWSELTRPFALPRDGTPTTLIRATRTDPPYVSDELDLGARRTPRLRLHPARLRLRPHGGPGQARGDRRADPRARGLTWRAITDEQVEMVRALVASIPAGRVATYGDIADAAGLSSPRIVGVDHAHRLLGSAVAPGASARPGRPAPHI